MIKTLPMELKLFVLDFQSKLAPKKKVETISTFRPARYLESNHEKWRTCDRCGNEVDLRKELNDNCVLCGGKFK